MAEYAAAIPPAFNHEKHFRPPKNAVGGR